MKCSFCDFEYTTGTGLTIFRKDGSSHRYCSRRCEKFAKMQRNPRKLKWTGKFEKFGGKAKVTKKKPAFVSVPKSESVEQSPVQKNPDAKSPKEENVDTSKRV